ncbi:MAG TPA: HD domain-containing phosphohydrolase [Anaeromyxobacter sp.]
MPALLDTQRAKVAALAITLGVVTALHSIVPVGTHPLHVVHVALAALYFVPIAASAAWFATRAALPVSAAAAGLYLFHAARAWSGQPMENANQVATAILFLWFGAVTGILAGMRDGEHAARLASEQRAQRAGGIQAIASLATALGFRDEGTRDHSERVAELAVRAAARMGWSGEHLESLRLAALVHDVGKIGIRDDVLLKPSALGPAELERIQRHPEIAAEILRPIAGTEEIARIVVAHHEAPDGSGYPRRLEGAGIPEGARILRVADVYCALRESRSYKEPVSEGDALRTMQALAGSKLDAPAFEALRSVVALARGRTGRGGDVAGAVPGAGREDLIPPARFRLLTPAYDLFCRALGLGAALRRFEMELVARLPHERVLDVGCGTGELLAAMASALPGSHLTGLDPDRDALRLARRKLDGRGPDARLVSARAESLPFEDRTFDLVVSSLMLHHLDSDTKVRALREWGRVLAPGGAILLVDLGVPRKRWLRLLLWPLRFRILEEQADNFLGRIPGLLAQARLAFEEVGVYRSAVVAYVAHPSRPLSRAKGASARPRTCAAAGHAHPSKPA